MHYHTLPCTNIPCTTTHYHSLRCTTTHYHTLPHATTHYHALPQTTMHYHTLPHTTMHYHTLPCTNIPHYHTLPCTTTCPVLCNHCRSRHCIEPRCCSSGRALSVMHLCLEMSFCLLNQREQCWHCSGPWTCDDAVGPLATMVVVVRLEPEICSVTHRCTASPPFLRN